MILPGTELGSQETKEKYKRKLNLEWYQDAMDHMKYMDEKPMLLK